MVPVLVLSVLLAGDAQQQQPPVPQPFPRPGGLAQTQPPRTTPAPQPPPPARPAGQPEPAPTEAMLGVPIYPGAQFLTSYDAGRGQRYYMFGSSAPFLDLVNYYKNVLKNKGELVFDVPAATYEFDIGKFNEDTMAFPPGVTIKEFASDFSEGFPNPKPNGQPVRFRSIIQIVPVVPK